MSFGTQIQGPNMSETQECCNLQRKVQSIAIGCIGIHIMGFFGEIVQIMSSQKYTTEEYGEVFHRRTIISMMMESLLGLISCGLLLIGAKKKNKFLLIPFMLIMVLLQVFLSITLFILGMACLSGDPVIFMSMVLITILISMTCWILRTVKLFYDEIRKEERETTTRTINRSDRQSENENIPQAYTEVSQPNVVALIGVAPPGNPESIFMSNQVNGTGWQFPTLTNVNEEIDSIPSAPEPPPAYTESSNIPSTSDGPEAPPSYDEAMSMKKRQVNLDDA